MSSDREQSSSGMVAAAAWVAVALTIVYLLCFVAIIYSDGRVARVLIAMGVPEPFLEFIYGWLAELVRS